MLRHCSTSQGLSSTLSLPGRCRDRYLSGTGKVLPGHFFVSRLLVEAGVRLSLERSNASACNDLLEWRLRELRMLMNEPAHAIRE